MLMMVVAWGSGSETVAIDVAGTVAADGDDAAIAVASSGAVTGTIKNSGTVTGGIEIAGNHTSTGKSFENTGNLTGGYNVEDGGLATSSEDHTIYTGAAGEQSGVTDHVSVAAGGQLTNTGTGTSTIYVDDGGTLGSGGSNIAVDVAGTVSADGGDAAIAVASGGTLNGTIENTGTVDGGISVSGTHTAGWRALNNSGTLTGGYTVEENGVVNSTGDHTLFTGGSGTLDKITVVEDGLLTNTGSGSSAIAVGNGGNLGSAADATAIEIAGTVSADGGDVAISITTGGTVTGTIDNTGTITGGIAVTGTHTSSGKTFNNTGNLTGGYSVAGGTVTSTGDHTIYTGSGGTTDNVVVSLGGQLTNSGSNTSAVYVERWRYSRCQ